MRRPAESATDLIDEAILGAVVFQGRSGADEIVRRLWDAGVPVGEVMQPHRQTDVPQLRFRASLRMSATQ